MKSLLFSVLTILTSQVFAETQVFDCKVQYKTRAGLDYDARIVLRSTNPDFLVPDAAEYDTMVGEITRFESGRSSTSKIGTSQNEKAFGPIWATVRHLKTNLLISGLPSHLDDNWQTAFIGLSFLGSNDPSVAAIVLDSTNKPVLSLVSTADSREAIICK